MHSEAQAARDDEDADRPRDDGDDRAGEERRVHEVLSEQVGEHQWSSSTW